ncbi:type I-E CRISPR-associated endoribonuclease Cas2 [Bifidobacterium longum subsp. longum]|uniref:type I-E CRISPR-associated endoribonuclease Cas2 n=1 Tax=Bifidobacterium longum TaxID=216816 RepID=UPI003B9A2B25
MVEISSGVYVGDLNTRIRTRLWQRVLSELGTGRATMAWHSQHQLHVSSQNGRLC